MAESGRPALVPEPGQEQRTRVARTVAQAVDTLAAGDPVVVVEDGGAFLVLAAELATAERMAFLVRHTAGLVCVALDGAICDRLRLPPMALRAQAHRDTAYCVSVDLHGTGTGISASARARTVAALADPDLDPAALNRPGHVIPLRVRDGGVLERPGPAEAAVDLARLAGAPPAAALSELLSTTRPGEVATGPEARAFAVEHGLAVVTIADVVTHRAIAPVRVRRAAATALPTDLGRFTAVGYVESVSGTEHVALVAGPLDGGDPGVVRVHRECLLGDVVGSTACGCGSALRADLAQVAASGRGVVVYLRSGIREASCACPRHTTAATDAARAILADLHGLPEAPASRTGTG